LTVSNIQTGQLSIWLKYLHGLWPNAESNTKFESRKKDHLIVFIYLSTLNIFSSVKTNTAELSQKWFVQYTNKEKLIQQCHNIYSFDARGTASVV
jgi:1,2-phenylacetyl-CoA epoxidase catalytic subunit